MKPSPNEIIAGVRNLLRKEIAPVADSEQAALTLRRIMVVLRETDWDEAAFHLLRENAVFQELGRKIITRYRGDKVCDVAALEELVQNPVLVDRFSAATAMNVAYRQRFAALMRSDRSKAHTSEMIVAALANFEPEIG